MQCRLCSLSLCLCKSMIYTSANLTEGCQHFVKRKIRWLKDFDLFCAFSQHLFAGIKSRRIRSPSLNWRREICLLGSLEPCAYRYHNCGRSIKSYSNAISDSVIPDTKNDFFSRKNSGSAVQHTFEMLCLVESGHGTFSYVCYGVQAYGGAFFLADSSYCEK